ncbi:MAG: S9 family peptidase [Steroidobacteraceae bacterium]
MTRSALRAGLLAAALLPLALRASAAPAAPSLKIAPPAPSAPFYRELGHLILEGIPPLDERLAARLERYTNAREATFLDWLPDGSMLIATRFGDATQVHRVAAPLGAREQLTYRREPITVAAARPSAVDPGFAFLEDTGGDENGQLYYYPLPSQLLAGRLPTEADGAAGDIRLLSDGRAHHGGLVWSKDGRRLAFFGNERSDAQEDIYTVDLSAGARPRLLVAGREGSWRPLDWSPDGRQLLLEQSVSATESHVYLADAASGALTPLDSADRKADVREARFTPDGGAVYELTDAGGQIEVLRRVDLSTHASQDVANASPWNIDTFDASADGRYLAYVANQDGRSRLTVLDMRFKLHLNPTGLPDGVIGNVRFDRTGRRLAISAESAVSARDVYVYELERNTLVRWTRSEPGPVCASCAAFVPAELIHFPTWDRANGERRMLSAYLYQPRTPGPHPVLIDIHGGPGSEARPTFDPFLQFLVNELGYTVIAPNVRGSSGYGRTFLGLDDGVLREDALRDIGSLLVWIDLQPALDRERVAVLGSGYGGYLALASLADYNDRLRGAIDLGGIADFGSFLAHTAAWRRGSEQQEYGDERVPQMHDFLSRISPITKAKWIRRPLLVVQGLNDPRVPAAQSSDLVASLRARGDDVWYLAARNEGHGFRKKSNRDTYEEVAAMFLERLATAE